MSGIHCTQESQCLASPDLAEDDSIGAHAQRSNEQVLSGYVGLAHGAARRNQADRIWMPEQQFRGILDQDQTLMLGNLLEQCVKQRCLAARGAARNENILPIADGIAKLVDWVRVCLLAYLDRKSVV